MSIRSPRSRLQPLGLAVLLGSLTGGAGALQAAQPPIGLVAQAAPDDSENTIRLCTDNCGLTFSEGEFNSPTPSPAPGPARLMCKATLSGSSSSRTGVLAVKILNRGGSPAPAGSTFEWIVASLRLRGPIRLTSPLRPGQSITGSTTVSKPSGMPPGEQACQVVSRTGF